MPPIFLSLITLIVIINIALAFFNMIPFPPLDGSKVFFDLFPRYWRGVMNLGFSGLILALLAAFFLLPKVISLVFWLIVGQPFRF